MDIKREEIINIVAQEVYERISTGKITPNEARELMGIERINEEWANKHYLKKA